MPAGKPVETVRGNSMSNRFMARMAFALALIASTFIFAPGGASADTGTSKKLTPNFLGDLFHRDKPEQKEESKGNDDSDDDSRSEDRSGSDEGSSVVPGNDLPVVVRGSAPAVGENFNAVASSGRVRVRRPGRNHSVELTDGASLPVGSIVDARQGVAKLTTSRNASGAVQTARFSGGVFVVRQAKTARPITEIVLRGGHLGQCRRNAEAGAATISRKRSSPRRRLWAEGRGRFRTRGGFSTATVRGTGWITTDTCSGTRVTVRHGLVAVRDLRLKKTVLVPGGKSHVSRKKRNRPKSTS